MRDATKPVLRRRDFLNQAARITAATTTGVLASAPSAATPARAAARTAQDLMDPVRQALRASAVKREWIDSFLDPKAQVWARFDPELGYLLRNYFMRDGAYGAHTLCRFGPEGQRLQVNFPDQPCRINTYGNSFTQGHQISDGETWQEVLAAHFCEPIRNFGIGGFGVYQAYRRLQREEAAPNHSADYLIFNIWGDDHLRSVYSWRAFSFPPEVSHIVGGIMFHSNPWVHARLDPDTGALVEKPNVCPTPESLYDLCDPEKLCALFENDEVIRCLLAMRPTTTTPIGTAPMERMAATINFKGLDWSTPDTTRRDAKKLLHAYALQVGMRIMEKLDQFCKLRAKKLMVLLSYPSSSVWHACNNSPPDAPGFDDWHPRVFQDFLKERSITFVDTLPKHLADFQAFRLTPKQYVDRYYIGHYNPTGNHFFAYAVKDEILAWLEPKPPAYRGRDEETILRFRGYLPG